MSGKITASEIPTSQTDVSKSLKWAVLCLFVIFMFILCVYYIILRFCASVCVEPGHVPSWPVVALDHCIASGSPGYWGRGVPLT